jgi:hypothetical protein
MYNRKATVDGNIANVDVLGDINFSGRLLQNNNESIRFDGNVAIGTTAVNGDRLMIYEKFSNTLNEPKTLIRLEADAGQGVDIGFGPEIEFASQRDGSGIADYVQTSGSIVNYIYNGDNSFADKWAFGFNSRDDDNYNRIMTLLGEGKVGVGTTEPQGTLNIIQTSPSEDTSCLILEQLDPDCDTFEIIGTESATTTSTISTLTSGTLTKMIKCKINGTIGYIPFYENLT